MGAEQIPNSNTAITKEFLENILKKKVLTFKTSGGSNPGDNYLSILISLEIVLAEDPGKPLHLLFKTFPSHPTRQKLLEDTNLFLKEYKVYDVYLPELLNLQKTIIGNEQLLVPAMPELVAGAGCGYFCDTNDFSEMDPMLSNFLLMVDVRKTYGFQMANKLKSLGYHHVKSVLEELAKYHALGHAYKVHHKLASIKEKFPFLDDPFFTNPSQRPTMEAVCKLNVGLVMDSCKTFLDAKPEIKNFLNKFSDPVAMVDYLMLFLNTKGMDEEKVEGMMRESSIKCTGLPMKDQWVVVGHGDCWTNNMLFNSDDSGRVTESFMDLSVSSLAYSILSNSHSRIPSSR